MKSLQTQTDTQRWLVVTGATGYVGTRLIPLLLEHGHHVRAVGRSLEKLRSRVWSDHANVELVAADIGESGSLDKVLENCSTAFYFVHSMNSQNRDFAEKDRQAAHLFAAASQAAKIRRIVYLGGLGDDESNLSEHLTSRREVEKIFRDGDVPVTILRAAMIIGSGSASFEILRYLVERLPIMVTPRWVSTPCQPIAIRNVLNYLVGSLSIDSGESVCFDIGGPEVLTYAKLMEIYASEAHLARRWIMPVPMFTPRLSSYWIHLVTPVPSYIARPLAEGLRCPVVCKDSKIRDLIPQELLDCRSAIRIALDKTQHNEVLSRWTDAGLVKPAEWTTEQDPAWAGGTVYTDTRSILVAASAEEVWEPLIRLGGETGWYYGNWLWWLRGVMDVLIGGVSLRRGRRHPYKLFPGDVLDFWRVQRVVPKKLLILSAEMKVPGEAILEFCLEQIDVNKTRITQTAKFHPSGLTGIAYWYVVSPLHHFVFNGMLSGIAKNTGKKILSKIQVLRPERHVG